MNTMPTEENLKTKDPWAICARPGCGDFRRAHDSAGCGKWKEAYINNYDIYNPYIVNGHICHCNGFVEQPTTLKDVIEWTEKLQSITSISY